jgi:peptidoglycan/xylan/chitin deacetylase (PgdA/CDA1 family)
MNSIEHGTARPWQPAPAVLVTAVLHAAGLVLLVAHPSLWAWVLGGLAANHGVLAAASLWPRGRLLGPNLVRLPDAAAARAEVSLNFDDGPDPEVTPRVLDLLDRYRARASFFCIGAIAEAHPEIVREIVRRGHSVENHSYHHRHTFALHGLGGLRRQVQGAQSAIARIAGQTPRFFRAPAGFRNPLLDPVVTRCGLQYVSWTRRGFDTVRRDPDAVLRRLTRNLRAGDILLLHDGASARTIGGEPVVLAVLPRLLARLEHEGLRSVSLPAAWDGSGR